MAPEGRRTRGEKSEFYELVGKITLSVLAYPLEYVRVLIQVGHEPIPPKPARTFLGKPTLILPGTFKYMQHIRSIDGCLGLYRGLTPKICSDIVAGMVSTTVIEHLPVEIEEEQSSGNDKQKIVIYVHRTLRDTAARCVALVASQPFHVISIRCICQFVGREEKYSGMISSFHEIYKEEGIKGFFAGLVPRIIGEILTILISRTLYFIITTYIIEKKFSGILQQNYKSCVNAAVPFLASTLTYPFTVVSNVLAVNGSGLAAGVPPNMPIYVNWVDCWSHLSAMGQLKRGSSLFSRYYQGPYMQNFAGNPTFVQRNKFSPKKDV